jgi:hypothetical protein
MRGGEAVGRRRGIKPINLFIDPSLFEDNL